MWLCILAFISWWSKNTIMAKTSFFYFLYILLFCWIFNDIFPISMYIGDVYHLCKLRDVIHLHLFYIRFCNFVDQQNIFGEKKTRVCTVWFIKVSICCLSNSPLPVRVQNAAAAPPQPEVRITALCPLPSSSSRPEGRITLVSHTHAYNRRPLTRAHSSSHTHRHTHTGTLTQAHSHRHTHTDALTQTHSHRRTYTGTLTRTHSHRRTQTGALTQTHSHRHTHTGTLTQTHSHRHTQTGTLTQAHSHRHTHIGTLT